MTIKIQKKIILTQEELSQILTRVYLDGFTYGNTIDEEQRKNKVWSSKGRDTITYVDNKIKEILK